MAGAPGSWLHLLDGRGTDTSIGETNAGHHYPVTHARVADDPGLSMNDDACLIDEPGFRADRADGPFEARHCRGRRRRDRRRLVCNPHCGQRLIGPADGAHCYGGTDGDAAVDQRLRGDCQGDIDAIATGDDPALEADGFDGSEECDIGPCYDDLNRGGDEVAGGVAVTSQKIQA
jgi:hypothetical protein